MAFQQQDVAAQTEQNQDSTTSALANLDFAQRTLDTQALAATEDDDAPDEQATKQATEQPTDDAGDAAATSAPATHPLAQATAPGQPRPKPMMPVAQQAAPTMDYRLFYLNNASRYTRGDGQTDENKLNAAFYQTVKQTRAVVKNLPDAEFLKKLKEAGADYPEPQVKAALALADKSYGDYERGRFNAFAGTLRNAGLDTTYNKRRGYVTATDGVDTRAGDEVAEKMGMQPRTHSDAGYSAKDQVAQYYDQSKAVQADSAMPFQQTEMESQKARDFYQGGDHEVLTGYVEADGTSVVRPGTMPMPLLDAGRLYTSQVDPATGMPRLVAWDKSSDPNRIAGEAMNVQALLPKPAQLTVARVIGDLIPVASYVTGSEGSVWTGENQTMNALGNWAAQKVGYDPGRQRIETEGIGLVSGVARGLAAVGASNQKLLGFEKNLATGTAEMLGDYNFTIGSSGFQQRTAKQEKERLRAQQRESYQKAAQVQGNVNADQQGSMFSSLPAFFYNFSQQVGQQAIQQGLNVALPGAGFAYMAGTSTEQGYSDGRKAGLGEGAATALGGGLGMLTYATEKFFDIGISKYGRKLIAGEFEAELGAQLGQVIKSEKTALLDGVLADARKRGLQNLTAAETTALVEKAAPSFLRNVQTRINAAIQAAEKSATGQVALATGKEALQETLDQAAQTGAYSVSRQQAFEDDHGKLKQELAPWIKKSLEDGSNPLAEKSASQIYEEWYQAGLAGGLMGGVFAAPFARGMAKQATLAQAAQAAAEQNKNQQIATYLVEHGFTPKAADDLRQELKSWHAKHQLGVRTKVDGTPASDDDSDSENTLVYQSLLNKVSVLQRLAVDTNLPARVSPAQQPALIKLLAAYGNENVRTEQGLDTLFKVHEKQQDIQRLLEGKALTQRDALTGEPMVATGEGAGAATATNTFGQPGFDPTQGALGLSPEAYKLEVDKRRAALQSQEDGEGKDSALKQLEEEAGWGQDSGALGVITRNRAIGAWYEASALVQQLQSELTKTDGSDFAKRQQLRAQLLEGQQQVSELQKAMAQAVSESADGSLSRVQQLAQAQLELNQLREQSGDVFNGNLVRAHLQEGYLRHETAKLDGLVASEQFAALPLYQQNALRYQRDFFHAAFADQTDGGVQALQDYNLRRKEFIAQRQSEQQQALTQSQQQATTLGADLAALPGHALAALASPSAESLTGLLASLQTASAQALASGANPDQVTAVATAVSNVATAVEQQARQAQADPALRAQALQTLLETENEQRRTAATAAGQNPDELFARTPEWVDQDPEQQAEYAQKVNEALQAQQTPEQTQLLAQAAELRAAVSQLQNAPAYAPPILDEETELEKQWATHFASAGQLISAPASVETFGREENSTTGIPGRITALQNQLKLRENESEADYASRLATLDPREVAQLVAQAHYHLAQVQANARINNLLLGAGALPAGANQADLRVLDPVAAQELIELYEKDYLPALDKIAAALAAQTGSRFAKDDEHRAVYLGERARQLDAYVAGTQVLAGNQPALDLLALASTSLRQIQALTATARTPEVLTQATTLLAQAEEQLRQAFALAGDSQQQAATVQALHQEVLDSIELKRQPGEPATNTELKQQLQRYRQGLSYRGESEDGVFIALQQLFALHRGTWSQHYAGVVRTNTAGTDRFGLPAPAASLEQEQAVLGINAFFQGSGTTDLFPLDSLLGRHIAAQREALAKGSDAAGNHAISALGLQKGGFVSRFLLYVTGFPGAGKTQMVAGSGLATLASLRGATAQNPLAVLAVAPHDTQRANLAKALERSSQALALTPASVPKLLTQLRDKTLAAAAVVLDEGTILSGDESNQLFEHLETFNTARVSQGQLPVKVLVLGDPAQLSGKNQSGGRQALHQFVEQRSVIKYQLPTLVEIYRSGFVVLHQLQEELRNRILSGASVKDAQGLPVGANAGPVPHMAFSISVPGDYNTLAGVQYQSEASQRQQIADHIKQLGAAQLADPSARAQTLRLIVSEKQVDKEVAALTALGVANAASYVEKASTHGVLDVERAQGQEFDFVYVSVSETELDKGGKERVAPFATVRALNVAVSRAERYVSVRLSLTDQSRETELNNQQSSLQQFAPETADARTQRNEQKLDLLKAVGETAPADGPAPAQLQAGPGDSAEISTSAADEAADNDDEAAAEEQASFEGADEEAPAGTTSPLLTSEQSVPEATGKAVQAAQQVLAEGQPADAAPIAAPDAEVDAETEDDRESVADAADGEPVAATQDYLTLAAELSEDAQTYLGKLESAARTLRREVAALEKSSADPLVIAQAREVLSEVEVRIDQLDTSLQAAKASAVVAPAGYYAEIPAGATEPGQQGGVEVVLDEGGLPVSARVWKPEFDSDGQFTQLREVKLPQAALVDEKGQPKSDLAKLRSVRAWLDGQVRDLENKRIQLEKSSVAKLAAENKVIVHGHVMEAVADAAARTQRLASKNTFTNRLYKKLFGQQRRATASGQPTFDGVLNASQFRNVPLPAGTGANGATTFQGNGKFFLVYHPTFEHGRVSEDTRRQRDQNIFTIRYQEASGQYLDVAVLRNNSYEALAPGELHSVAAARKQNRAPSALDTFLSQAALRQLNNPNYALDELSDLGSSLLVENFKTPGFDRGLTGSARTLAEKYTHYEQQGLGASRPYVITVSGEDNVRWGDYQFNNKNGTDTRASLSGGTVIFTSQGLTHEQTTALVDKVLAQAQQEKWPNQRTVDLLLQEHNLEMDVQQEQPLSLQYYLQALAQNSNPQQAASAETFAGTLTTQRGLDPKSKRTVPVFKEKDSGKRKATWQGNQGGWLVKRSLFSMAQARPAGIAQDTQASERGELHPAAYKTYGLLNKLFNVLLDSGIAAFVKDQNGKKTLVLSEKGRKALTNQEAEHLQLILNEFGQRDRHLVNDGDSGRSYETRYNHDLLRYLGYLDQHGPLKGLVSQAWDNDTKGTDAASKRGKNEVQFRPSFVGKATGAFTKAGEVPGLDITQLLSSRREGMTDPSFVVNLHEAAVKHAPAQQSRAQMATNTQAVATVAQQTTTQAGGVAPTPAIAPASPALTTLAALVPSVRQSPSGYVLAEAMAAFAKNPAGAMTRLALRQAADQLSDVEPVMAQARAAAYAALDTQPQTGWSMPGMEATPYNEDAATGVPTSEPATTTEVGADQVGLPDLSDFNFNLNDEHLSLGDADPEEFIAQVKAAFGKSVPWALNLVGEFKTVLGAVVGEIISVNQAANGLVDRRTIKHEMVHYALRIVSPTYRQNVLDDARQKLLPKNGVSPERIAALSDKQVEEWLSKYYERVYQDYEQRAERFKQRTKYVPDSILRLFRALRTIYDRFVGDPDLTDRLFSDLERGLFRGRGVQRIYRGQGRNADGTMNLSQVDFNRNQAGQRQHDFLELEKVFGSPQRRQQALHLVTTMMQEQLNDYTPGKPFRGLAGALNTVRAGLLAVAAQTDQLRQHPTEPFVLDNHSANPAVALRTRNYLLVQPFQQAPAELDGEQQLRLTTTPLDVMVEYLYPHLKVNNRYDEARDPYAQDGDEALSGSDGQAESNGTSSGSKANNISSKAYYLEDKNKAAKPGVELHLLLQTVPLYSRDAQTGKYQRDAGRRTVDFRSVNAALRRAVADARQAVAKDGRTDVTLEDVRQALLTQFSTQGSRANYATGNRRDTLASLYLKLFGGVGQVNTDGTFASDHVLVQGHAVKLNGQVLSSTPFSMYQVAYPERAGAVGVNAAQLVNLADEPTALYALHYQRLLSQLLGHYTSTQRREYLSVDLTDGARENKSTDLENGLSKRKNYNQQTLLNKFYTRDNAGQWQPSAAPLKKLAEATFKLTTAGTRTVTEHGVVREEPRIVLTHKGNEVLELGQYEQGGGQGYTATGSFAAGLSDKLRVDAAHQLLSIAGLPFDKAHLAEMLGSREQEGRSDFQGFENFLGTLLARVWTSALGDHAMSNVNRTELTSLGATTPEVQAYLTGALAATSDYREGFGNYDNLNAIDGQGFDESRAPQYRLSPTAHFSQMLGLAQYQNDWVRADVSDYAYSAEGQKIYLEQLGNGYYPQVSRLQAQRANFAKLRAENWQPGQPKTYLQGQADGTDVEVTADFAADLFGTGPGEYTNTIAKGDIALKMLQVNGLSDTRTGRKKSMVGATAVELHQLAVEHLFGRSLLQSAGKTIQLFGAVISDKNTQRIFELSGQKAQVALLPGTKESDQALRNVYQSYEAFLHHQVLPRFEQAGFVASEQGRANSVRLLQELQTWLSAQATAPKNLVKIADHNGKGQLNPELVRVLTLGADEFVRQAGQDAVEDARRLHADGYTVLPKKLVDALVKAKLLPAFNAENFATKPNDKGESYGYRTRGTDGSFHPLLLLHANSAFIHGHALQTALDGHHLNYKGSVDRAKRGIISATNYESYDVHTPRGLGQTSKMLVMADLSFAPVAGGQTFGLLDAYGRYEVSKLAGKEAQDGQGYMSPLHAMLEDESLGGKYMSLASPDEMQALGYERTAFPRKISQFGTRKNIHGDGRGNNGSALLVKDSKTVLTNNYLANANEKAYDLISKMLGGYDSPLYQRWRQLHDEATPEQRAANADWVKLYDAFIQPENRAQWEPHHFGVASHPSAVKIGESQKVKFGEAVAAGQVPHLVLDNRFSGKVLNLAQDPAGADISRITQEDHIISLLGDNFQTAQQVYGLLGQLATDGLFDLSEQVAAAGGEHFFMQRLQDLLLNLGNVSNTLSLVRAWASPDVPLVLQPLHSAISSSIKAYATKLRNKGLRATVQSSTGLVQLYNVLDAETQQAHRLPKSTLVKWGYATLGERGQLVPTTKAAQLEEDELKFMHLRERASGRELSPAEAKAFMQVRLAVKPGEEAAFETMAREKYTLEPMEMLIPRDFVKAFSIPADWDVADVLQAGEEWFVAQELVKGFDETEAMQRGVEKWQNFNDILDVKGTRIPVTNLNSIQMGRVVGFHDGSQNVALVPSEMLLIAGADNDGDMITLEFLDLDKQGLRHRDVLDSQTGEVKLNEKGIREEILTSKRDNVLLNPFNVDQLFKPIDFSRFDDAVAQAEARADELTSRDEATGYQLPTGGAARYAENISQWITNQAGKSGVGPMVKAREAYNALHNYARQHPALASFSVPSYWLGREVTSPLADPREVSYLFEDFANAALDNAKENYLGKLNFAQETWGVYSALIMTRQNFQEIMDLMTHPYTSRLVRQVQQNNKVSDKQRTTLQGVIEERLKRQAPAFDETGARSNNVLNADGSLKTKYTGFGYQLGKGNDTLFAQVQARQAVLHQSEQFPDLSANVGSDATSEQAKYEAERYVLENLYLAAVRGDELLAAQGILATMDGVNGPDYDNQRGIEKLLSALPVSQKDTESGLADLQRVLDSSPDEQLAWAVKHQVKTKTINAAALLVNNPFVQSSVRAMLLDKQFKQRLFLARQPRLQKILQALVKELAKHNGQDKRSAHKLVMRGLDEFVTHDYLQSYLPAISLEAQQASALLSQLASQDVSTIAGRTQFGQLAAAYVEELKTRERGNPQAPGVQDSPLLQELTLTGGNYGRSISLNNAADLDPENKQVLESLFGELGDVSKYGVEGPALQQVLLTYNLSRNGLHLGKGSLAEVLSAQSLAPVSEHARALAARWDEHSGQLNPAQFSSLLEQFKTQLFSQNPGMTTELRAVKELPEGMEVDEEVGILPETSARYFFADPSSLPDSFGVGHFRSAAKLGQRNVSAFPEFAHIKNEKSPGKVVLYRRTGSAEKPIWRRQYSALNPAVNNYGEYGYSVLPVLEGQSMWPGDEKDDTVMQKLQTKARELGQIKLDGRFEIKMLGNQTLSVDKELRCK